MEKISGASLPSGRSATWGHNSVRSCRSYSRAKGLGTSAGATPMERIRGDLDGVQRGLVRPPETPWVSSPERDALELAGGLEQLVEGGERVGPLAVLVEEVEGAVGGEGRIHVLLQLDLDLGRSVHHQRERVTYLG
jgi:hypothetical protein